MQQSAHKLTYSTPAELLFFFCTSLAVVFIELVIFARLLKPEGIMLAMVLHLLVLVSLWFYCSSARIKGDIRLAQALLLMTAIGGVFGAGFVLLIVSVYAFSAGKAASSEDMLAWIDELSPISEVNESQLLQERLSVKGESDQTTVKPLTDVISNDGQARKQSAIVRITRHFKPQFAPLLKAAVKDESAAVRVQAANALAKLQNDFASRIQELESKMKGISTADPRHLKLADLYDEYAYAGIVDEITKSELRAKAVQIYEANLKAHNDFKVRERLARLYIRMDESEKAKSLLEEEVEGRKTCESSSLSAELWYAESLFRLGQFKKVRNILEDLRIKTSSGALGQPAEKVGLFHYMVNREFLAPKHG